MTLLASAVHCCVLPATLRTSGQSNHIRSKEGQDGRSDGPLPSARSKAGTREGSLTSLVKAWEQTGVCMEGEDWAGSAPGQFCGHILGFHDPERQPEKTFTRAALDPISPPETPPSPLKLVNFLFLSTLAFPPPACITFYPSGSVISRTPGPGLG